MGIYEWLDSLSLRFIDAVVLVDQTMRSHPKLKKLNGVEFRVINNGIPFLPDSAPSNVHTFTRSGAEAVMVEKVGGSEGGERGVRNIVEFCQRGFTLGSIGRLSDEKGFNFLIEALHALRQRGADVRLVIIGEGSQRPVLEKQISALGIDDYVSLSGYVRNAKQMIACFDVFVIPSLTEGLPISLLEAMQAQVPVVATAVGGMPEVLDHGRAGVLVDPGEPISLADEIMKYFLNPNLSRQTAARAFERVNSCYNSRCMAEGYLRIYEKVSALN
jgi:glycosyltransferase involved in cell wall biosynthesis